MENINESGVVEKHIENLTAGSIKGAMAANNAARTDLWKVPRASLKTIDGFNVRSQDDPQYQAHIQWLADSIRANGFYPDRPLTGYVARENNQNIIYVIDGHSRLAAIDILEAKGVEIPTIPVVVRPKGTTAEDITVALFTSNGGKPLTMLETGVVCKRLVEFGWNVSDISRRLGKSTQHVENTLTLAGAPLAIRKLVSSGAVSGSLAIEALQKYGDKALEKLEGAVQSASKAGKARATAKNIQSGPLAIKSTLKTFVKDVSKALESLEKQGVDLWENVDASSESEIDQDLMDAILAVRKWVLTKQKDE